MVPEFGPKKRLEREYADAIGKVVKRILAPKKPEQTLEQWLAEIAANSQRKDVTEASEFIARQMITRVNTSNLKTWRDAANKWGRGQQLYKLLSKELQGATGKRVRELVLENANYIKSIALEQAQRLTGEVAKAQQQGARAGTVAKMMRQRFPELLRSRVDLIARTETAKASSALTQSRAEDLDLPIYIWMTSKDVRVRPSHKLMDGVVCFWNDPPNPEALNGEKSTLGAYNVGNCPNDRCTARVVLTLQDIQWPARVAYSGGVHHMNKQQFIAKFGFKEEREAA
jgi:SPP1 gp7 family putative phage head morphogenesis protein